MGRSFMSGDTAYQICLIVISIIPENVEYQRFLNMDKS